MRHLSTLEPSGKPQKSPLNEAPEHIRVFGKPQKSPLNKACLGASKGRNLGKTSAKSARFVTIFFSGKLNRNLYLLQG